MLTSSSIEKLPKLGTLAVALTAVKPVAVAPPVNDLIKAVPEHEAPKKSTESIEREVIKNELSLSEDIAATEEVSVAPPAQTEPEKPVISQNTPEIVKKPEPTAWVDDGDLEALVQETLAKKEPKMHMHPYSGDRLWND